MALWTLSVKFLLLFGYLLNFIPCDKAANPDGSCTNPKFRWFSELDAFYHYANQTGNNQTIPAIRVNISSTTTSARCLDGSGYFFYYRKGFGDGLNKYQIYLQGGGWCNSFQNCYQRAQSYGYLGSSSNYGPYAWYSADYLSDNQTSNPLMYNWNTVWMIYCDGSSFTGNNMTIYPYKVNESYTMNLYFRGHENLKQGMTVLYNQYGLDAASDVVLSGCSAGGMAVYLNNDYIFENFVNPQAALKFMSIPQSGLFPYDNPLHSSTWHLGILWIYDTQNVTDILNRDCVDYYRKINDSLISNCMFSQYVSRFLNKNKIFALQSIFDAAGMSEQQVNANDVNESNQYGQWYTQLFMESFINTNSNLHGALLYSCYSHCGEYNNINVSNILTGNAIQMMYNNEQFPNSNHLVFQNETYPCNDCCFADYIVPSNISNICTHPNEKCDPDCDN